MIIGFSEKIKSNKPTTSPGFPEFMIIVPVDKLANCWERK
jgi:hypothetical protein